MRFARSRTLPPRWVQRARIVLQAAAGKADVEIAKALDIRRQTVGLWRPRFLAQGIAGMEKEAPRSGRPRRIPTSQVDAIVALTTRQTPAHATHWSTRTLAQVAHLSPSTGGRIWRAHGLQPHRVRSFQLSHDRHFAQKLEDVVSLYLHPPEQAIVLSVDEKCPIQALQRTQPGLPCKKGRCGTMTHDYKRHGTTTLFAAMNIQDGSVIDVCMPTHNRWDWLRFLKLINRRTVPDQPLHLIMDNYSAHKAPEVQKWRARHPRFQLPGIPTSSSWLTMVERFFRDLTVPCIRRGVFHSVAELQPAVREYIDGPNRKPTPYLWTAKARDILEKVKRAWMKLRASGFMPKSRKFAALDSIDRRLAAADPSDS